MLRPLAVMSTRLLRARGRVEVAWMAAMESAQECSYPLVGT